MLFSSLFFATLAAAQTTTTSYWFPGSYGREEYGYYASVVGAGQDGRVTLKLSYDNDTRTVYSVRNVFVTTATVGPLYYGQVTTTSINGDDSLAITSSLGCTKAQESARATCVYSRGGPGYYDYACDAYTTINSIRPASTRVLTVTYPSYSSYPASTYTTTRTYPATVLSIPSICRPGASTAGGSLSTTLLAPSSQFTHQVIITAGAEKLASPTGSAVITGTNGSVTPVSAAPTGTAASSGTVPGQTGAAAQITPAAVLGFAAVAAMVL